MGMTDGDMLVRSYATLMALKGNLPEEYELDETWVRRFNSALEGIGKATGKDLADFTVRADDLHRSVASSNYVTGDVTYNEGLWCKRSLLMMKIDAVIAYCSGLQSDVQRRIGFNG
jgi:hypothetical protein